MKDFTTSSDWIREIGEVKRASAKAMIDAINQALTEGSLVLNAEMAIDGQGIPFAFLSREDMMAERDRLLKMVA